MTSPFGSRSRVLLRPSAQLLGLAIVALVAGCGDQNSGSQPNGDTKPKSQPPPQDTSKRWGAQECLGSVQELVSQVRVDRGLGTDSVAISVSLKDRTILSSGGISEPFARSTIKVVILTLLLEERGGPEGLNAEERELASRMIKDSDNEAAADLYSRLVTSLGSSADAADAMTEILRRSGDSETTVPASVPQGLPASFISNYGATSWLPESQVKFVRALLAGRLVNASSRTYILGLMGQITALGGGSWGLGTLSTDKDPRFKPGWGDTPNGQYLARQIGVVELGGQPPPAPLAVAALAPSQVQAYATVTALAQGVTEVLGATCGR